MVVPWQKDPGLDLKASEDCKANEDSKQGWRKKDKQFIYVNVQNLEAIIPQDFGQSHIYKYT